jgi:Arylsulfotransferase (ASST)
LAPLRSIWFRRHWDAVLFAAACTLLVYLGGMATAHYRLLPYTTILDAVGAGRDWHANWRSYLGIAPTRFLVPAEGQEKGVVVHVPGAPQPGLTLISGISEDGVVGLQLIDLQGRVRHRWPASFSRIWPAPEHVHGRRPPDNDWDTEIHGAALLPGGDVVFNFDRFGLQRLDPCGELVWKLPYMSHHSVFVGDDGNLWVPGVRYHTAPVPSLPGVVPPFEEDMILEISPDGTILREISLLELFYANELEALLFANGRHRIDDGSHNDLLHLNDIEILSLRDAAAFPLFEAGDIMVSLRNLNLVMVIDPATKTVRWLQTGPWIRQHDPDFLPNGRIMVFDNRRDESGRQVLGGSRILTIDPVTRQVQTVYEGSDEAPFFSNVKGKQQLLANGNVLITEAERGRAFEVTPHGRIVWSYISRFDDEHIAKISGAERYSEAYAAVADDDCLEDRG